MGEEAPGLFFASREKEGILGKRKVLSTRCNAAVSELEQTSRCRGQEICHLLLKL